MRERTEAGPKKEDQLLLTGLELLRHELERRAYYGITPSTQGELALLLGLSKQSVNQWKAVPAIYVLDVCQILDLAPDALRPDVFGDHVARREAAIDRRARRGVHNDQ